MLFCPVNKPAPASLAKRMNEASRNGLGEYLVAGMQSDCRQWSLGVAPKAARQVIESVTESNWFPQAGEAGMTLRNLDSGIFKPE
jgi:Domain of unknown function (DUF2019)